MTNQTIPEWAKDESVMLIQRMLEYSMIPNGCEHVTRYPDFQTWMNMAEKALTQAYNRGVEDKKKEILDLVLDDVPHQYQKRLLEVLK